jgi:hypothetical protein
MATTLNDIYLGIGYLFLTQRSLPDDIKITPTKGRILTGIVIKTGDAPVYEVGCIVTFSDINLTTVNVNNTVYYLIQESDVIFERHPETAS